MTDDNTRKVQGLEDDIRNLLITETRRTGGDPSFLFEILEGIIEKQAWFDLKDKDGQPVGSLQRLIESPPPVGCGMSMSRLRQLLKLEHRYEGKSDEWKQRMVALRKRLDEELSELNTQDNTGRGKTSDMSEVSKTGGNSKAYRIARLKRDAPDIAERVINDEISASAGMRELRVRQGKPEKARGAVNFLDAQSAYNTLTKYMPDDVLQELIELLIAEQESE